MPKRKNRGGKPKTESASAVLATKPNLTSFLHVRFSLLLLILLCVVAYHQTLEHEFVFDDRPCIVENPTIGSFDSPFDVYDPSVPRGLQRRIIPSWTFTLNYLCFGFDVAWYRIVNLLIHITASIVVFDLVRRTMLRLDAETHDSKNATLFAFAVASVWSLHPIQTESVTYIVQRIESLMGLFFFASIYFVLLGERSKKGFGFYALSIFCVYAGMMTKEVMFTAPFVILLFDWTVLGRSFRDIFKNRGWLYLAYLPAMIWMMWVARLGSMIFRMFGASKNQASPSNALDVAEKAELAIPEWSYNPERWEFMTTQPRVVLQYVRQYLFPDKLMFDGGWPLANGLSDTLLPATILFALLLVAICFFLRKKSLLGFSGISFFIVLAPTSSLIPLTIYFEHRLYVPSVFLAILSIGGLFWMIEKFNHDGRVQFVAKCTSIGILIVVLEVATIERNRVYANEGLLVQDTVAKSPSSLRALFNLGSYRLNHGQVDEAIVYLEKAKQLEPKHYKTDLALARAYLLKGQLETAKSLLEPLQERFAGDSEIHHIAALLYEKQRRYEMAIYHFDKAIELNQAHTEFYVDYAAMLSDINRLKEAMIQLERGYAIDPSHVELNINIGTLIMMTVGDRQEAVHHFQRALSRDPNNKLARSYLERALNGGQN